MKQIRAIDYSVWLTLGIILTLALLIKQFQFPFAFAIIILGLVSGANVKWPRLTDWLFAIIVAYYLYKIWPHMFFDDAGFIIRYLNNVKDGYWFQYNPGEGAVFGISGFMHGLFCSLLVKITGIEPERALHISNLTGLVLTVYFLTNIFRYFVTRTSLSYIITFIVVCFSKTWADVLFTGMETPLHVAFVMGAFYFLLYNRIQLFYLFAAISIISKLDAVPIMAVLFLFLAVEQIRKVGIKQTFIIEAKRQILYFWLPLVVWIAFSTRFFGSPLPQSAKAKLLYHSGVNDDFFPFLTFGFIDNAYKFPMLFIFLAYFIIHAFYITKNGIRSITYYFGFGWMFVAIMTMYYFYNPNERMLWYYALPELLLTAQCVLSTIWIANQAKDWKHYVMPYLGVIFWLLYLKPDTDGGRDWMFDYLGKLERERFEVGKYIVKYAKPEDKLLAWHGLLAARFPGYVLDGTGLNSKLALELKLDIDTMLATVNPKFGIHHGFQFHVDAFSRNGYFVRDIYGDVTLQNWPAWILWEKHENGTKRSKTMLVTDSMVAEGKITNQKDPLKIEGRRVIINLPFDTDLGVLWTAFEGRGSEQKDIKINILGGNKLLDSYAVQLPRYGKEDYPSLFTYGQKIKYARENIDSTYQLKIELLPTGNDTVVKLNNPLLEYNIQQP